MSNIISYIKWRGDFSFDQIPFNELDNLILAELSYLDLNEIVSGSSEGDFSIRFQAVSSQSRAVVKNKKLDKFQLIF